MGDALAILRKNDPEKGEQVFALFNVDKGARVGDVIRVSTAAIEGHFAATSTPLIQGSRAIDVQGGEVILAVATSNTLSYNQTTRSEIVVIGASGSSIREALRYSFDGYARGVVNSVVESIGQGVRMNVQISSGGPLFSAAAFVSAGGVKLALLPGSGGRYAPYSVIASSDGEHWRHLGARGPVGWMPQS